MSQTQDVFPHSPIESLEPGGRVDSVYLLAAVDRRLKKNGEPFFILQLSDATGIVNAVIWDNHEELESGAIPKDSFVHVFGDAGEYNGTLQLTLKRIVFVEDKDVDLRAFLPVSPRPLDEMEKELDEWIAKVKQNDCARLLQKIFGHKRLRDLYCHAPAAVRIHQAYIHGLLEHTLNVMKLADSIANLYEPIDRDLLITGTLIHDIGKIRELDWKRSLTYTTEGRLMGHIPMGASMIDAIINELRKQGSFDHDIQNQVIHMILSHHGKLEWGSPITPKTREAMVLHYADNTEAYMTVFSDETRRATERGELWTGWSKMFSSYLYAGKGTNGSTMPGEELSMGSTPGAPGPADDIYPPR